MGLESYFECTKWWVHYLPAFSLLWCQSFSAQFPFAFLHTKSPQRSVNQYKISYCLFHPPWKRQTGKQSIIIFIEQLMDITLTQNVELAQVNMFLATNFSFFYFFLTFFGVGQCPKAFIDFSFFYIYILKLDTNQYFKINIKMTNFKRESDVLYKI